VTIDATLSFNTHVANVAGSVKSVARAIRHVRPSIGDEHAVTLAISLGLSKLDYANAIYAGLSKQNVDRLQKAQNSLARSVLGMPLLTPHKSMLSQLHWLPVQSRIDFKLLSISHHALASLMPPYIISSLTLQPPPRNLHNFSGPVLVISPSRLKFTARRFSSSIPRLWNSQLTSSTHQELQRIFGF
jgi:hypothetical protein